MINCSIGNEGMQHMVSSFGETNNNNALTDLSMGNNGIQDAEGGRQIGLLLQRFPNLEHLVMANNSLGPLGARALAPGLAAARQLQRLELHFCGLRNEGVINLIPDGQVNRSLTYLNLGANNIHGTVGGENVVALASRCTNLDSVDVDEDILSSDQQRRLDLLLDRKRLVTKAQALGGSTFPVLFRFVEEARCHEQGLGAIFVILQNDGEDYFYTAHNRAIE
jgi:hypothetical protein